jgi:IS605 OrfB family transposase
MTQSNRHVPFWDIKCSLLSERLWNPENYKENLVSNKSLYMTETIHQGLNQNIPNLEEVETEKLTVAKKIRFYPNKEQKEYLNKCFSFHRYFYNKTIEEINKRYNKRKEEFNSSPTCIFCSKNKTSNSFCCDDHQNKPLPWNLKISFLGLKSVIVKNNRDLSPLEEWQADVAHDTRVMAVKDAVSAYTSASTNRRRGNIKQFQMGFMSKKKPTHIFWADHRTLKFEEQNNNLNVHLFKHKLKKNSLLEIKPHYKKQIRDQISKNESAVKVLFDRGAWYLVFTVEIESKIKCQNLHSIALDPGVRTFQTGYSPNGLVCKFGENQLNEMKKIYSKIDSLKSVSDSKNPGSDYKKRYHIKKRLAKLEFKLRSIIHNLHNQVSCFLARNYKYILIPEFGTSDLQQSIDIHSTTKRRMNGLAHYKFQQKLIHQCKKYGSQIEIVDESYTSKTCGNCGKVKNDLGSACHYECSDCGYNLDRDIHGARNIWIKTYSRKF